MNFENLIKELKESGFKVIRKTDSIRIIKNSKAITYEESKWNNFGEDEKRAELLALYKVFS